MKPMPGMSVPSIVAVFSGEVGCRFSGTPRLAMRL